MPASELINRYARAVFASAAARGQEQQMADDLQTLAELMRSHVRLRECLLNPTLPVALKQSVIEQVYGTAIGAPARDLMDWLIEKRRGGILPGLAARFQELLEEQEGICRVNITSALPIFPKEMASWERRLAGVLSCKIRLETRVDASLLGGIVIRVGDRCLDGSCRGRLEAVRNLLVNT